MKAILCLAVMASLLRAQTPMGSTPARIPPRYGITGEVPLTLQDAVAAVVAANRQVESADLARRIARLDLLAARGAYDPRVTGEAFWLREVAPVASLILAGPGGRLITRQWSVAPGIAGLTPWFGGSYSVSLTSSQYTTNNEFVILNPQYRTALMFNVTQPLLRGFRFDQYRLNIQVARRNTNLSEEQFRQTVMDLTNSAAQAYWELEFARAFAQVQAEGVQLAEQQLASNERLVKQGLLAEVGIIEAQTQLATSQLNLQQAMEAWARAENALKSLILGTRRSPLWGVALVPVTPIPEMPDVEPLPRAVDQALANRPELRQVEINTEINQLQTRLNRELTRPQVDLVGTYTSNGLAGTQVPPRPNPFASSTQVLFDRVNELSALAGLPQLPSVSDTASANLPQLLIGGYPQSFQNLLRQRFPTFRLGLQVSIPIRNRTAEANLGISQLQARQLKAQREQVEQQVESEVRTATESMLAARSRLDAAHAAVQYAQQQYASEVRQFQAGLSTVFLVLQRQTELVVAQSREARAEADVGSSIATYRRATGRILSAFNITLK